MDYKPVIAQQCQRHQQKQPQQQQLKQSAQKLQRSQCKVRTKSAACSRSRCAISSNICGWHKVAQLSLLLIWIVATSDLAKCAKIPTSSTSSAVTAPALAVTTVVVTTPVITTPTRTTVTHTLSSDTITEKDSFIGNYNNNNNNKIKNSNKNDMNNNPDDCTSSQSTSSSCSTSSTYSRDHSSLADFSILEKEVVDRLIKEWAPVVWLAPEEKFMPLGVEEFLDHVHPIEKDKTVIPGMPIGDQSEKAYLVTNADIEELLQNENSFIYGRNPNEMPVPIYAVVTLCNKTKAPPIGNNVATTVPIAVKPTQKQHLTINSTRGPYIPISFDILEERNNTVRRSSRLYPAFKRVQRSASTKLNIEQDVEATEQAQKYTSAKLEYDDLVSGELATPAVLALPTNNTADSNASMQQQQQQQVNNFIANLADNVKFSIITPIDEDNNIASADDENTTRDNLNKFRRQDVPSFHVTYWMFYPYSQGKTMCTLSLGPLGHIPFPAVYGFCLGKRKDIGSHIGDWEHMSLYFNGAAEPEALYVSAHDAGAYYSFNRLTGSFEFKKQETRKGILQRPNFPKTVTTFNNHPVLFAAKGSHGLWTAPGKHRFVKVARLYDINGFGTLWNTWKAIHITYENIKSYGRSFIPTWLSFKGKWGNPKSKCHPFKRIGLNFCEYTDGPTGIPLKESHFQCGATYR